LFCFFGFYLPPLFCGPVLRQFAEYTRAPSPSGLRRSLGSFSFSPSLTNCTFFFFRPPLFPIVRFWGGNRCRESTSVFFFEVQLSLFRLAVVVFQIAHENLSRSSSWRECISLLFSLLPGVFSWGPLQPFDSLFFPHNPLSAFYLFSQSYRQSPFSLTRSPGL